MSPTFTGPIGGWSTQGQDSPQQTEEPAATADDSSHQSPASQPTAATQDPDSTANAAPKSITSVEATSIESTLAVAPSSTSTHETKQSSYSALPSPTASSVVTPTSKSNADEGTSPGAKAGIAFGVLGGVLLVGLIVFLVFNRRKRQVQRRSADNEKLNGAGDTLARMPSHSDPRAPRISLRPVTQFLPNWNMEKNAQRGAANLAPAAANQWDRPGTSQSNHPNNPFGSGAERIYSPDGPARDPWTANGPAVGAVGAVGAVAGAAGAAAGTAALARKTSMRKANQKDVDLTVPGALDAVPPSPAGTEFSTSSIPAGAPNPPSQSAAAIAAAGGPPSSAVHRVQLDFKPTLEDEMELTAGDLVRLLHEYDDGWALCIRLDRSQQGVVPRTCLSTRPVKPRAPQGAPRPGPPINPQGGYPQGSHPQGGYPRGPNQPGRPMTPQGRPMTPQGRPMTPQGPHPQQGMGPRPGGPMTPGRPQSPGPRYQGPPSGRPQSPSGMNPRPMGPSGPSPMNPAPASPSQAPQRKPVPGQAY
ncbi:SH3 domain protein [Cordyceps fumosorosea ARSEF 2679]|uniref:SH3 domain protein n=1 Tax=Cordyceps fumosorosea (strain ARSEF 2679) TaxID=1081104 RepID=A0A167U8K7_CORFA|nr:SH3 domain protein [Cordyceps fumosorosea ARSEF 2679]OAA61337.1 SH3 domain protein [Cordyceps fumosorosea ARSEF 2679]